MTESYAKTNKVDSTVATKIWNLLWAMKDTADEMDTDTRKTKEPAKDQQLKAPSDSSKDQASRKEWYNGVMNLLQNVDINKGESTPALLNATVALTQYLTAANPEAAQKIQNAIKK